MPWLSHRIIGLVANEVFPPLHLVSGEAIIILHPCTIFSRSWQNYNNEIQPDAGIILAYHTILVHLNYWVQKNFMKSIGAVMS